MIEIKTNKLTAEVFLAPYASVGREPTCMAQVQAAFQNSLATFAAFDDGKPMGMARLIGDGKIILPRTTAEYPSISRTLRSWRTIRRGKAS